MNNSIWTSTASLPSFDVLKGEVHTEVLIIGGGLCGILCAYFLQQLGIDYLLVEGSTIGSGITKNTTAKITSQHGLIYDRLLKVRGRELASLYLWENEKALHTYRELAQTIPCDFETRDAYVYTLKDLRKIENEIRTVNSLGLKAEFAETPMLPLHTLGAIRFPGQAQFHPLKFLSAIAKDLHIFEHTFIRDLAEHTAWFDGGKITADKIIVTTHFPFLNKHGSYFLKLYQHRSYVLALDGAADVKGMYLDEARDGLSFRNHGRFLLLGGGSHRTGGTGGNFAELRSFAADAYPRAREANAWATQDCMSLDGVPYIGPYSKHTPTLYVASGFNKWGMTSSMMAAQLLCDLVTEKENPSNILFSPSRSMLKPQLLVNGGVATTNFLKPTKKRCPHMGCALSWNPQEHSWDCACHGSRFEADGRLIDNPATGNIELDK